MNKNRLSGGLVKEDLAMQRKGAGEADDAAYRIGLGMIEALMQEEDLSYERAVSLLLEGGAPSSAEALSAAAAEELSRLERSGELVRSIDEYLQDVDFIALLREMPASAAVRVYEAQQEKNELTGSLTRARDEGERRALERLKARKALPRSTRAQTPASADIDFFNMSSEEFYRFKEELAREARR